MGHSNNSDAQSRSCKGSWKCHSGRLNCPSQFKWDKDFFPFSFLNSLQIDSNCHPLSLPSINTLKGVQGGLWGPIRVPHIGPPPQNCLPHAFCMGSFSRGITFELPVLVGFFQLLHCQAICDGDVMSVIGTQQTPTKESGAGNSVHLNPQTAIR